MIYHIVAIPQKEDLEILNNLREHIYQNDFRFKNKPLSSDTHMTIAEIDVEEGRIEGLKEKLKEEITQIPFVITENEWVLTKEDKDPNYKQDNPYTWIALKFPKRKELYNEVEKVIDEMGVNKNEQYISNVKKIEKKEEDYIANHVNLSNYTRKEKGEECWDYFRKNLPKKIVFDALVLRDIEGKHLFEIKY